MRVGVAVDHTGFTLKDRLVKELRAVGHEVVDFGAPAYAPDDDYTDYTVPLARAVVDGAVARGIAVCDNAIGACIAANKIRGIRAGTCHDQSSAGRAFRTIT
jgi:ribose 5-phosphate isomerase B